MSTLRKKQHGSVRRTDVVRYALLFSACIATILFAQYQHTYKLTEPAWVYIGRAKRFIAQGEVGEALRLLNTVVVVESNNADAHYVLGDLHNEQALYDIAIIHYRAVVKYAETLTIPAYEIEAYFKLLHCYKSTGQFVETEGIKKDITRIAKKTRNPKLEGRLYFEMAGYLEEFHQWENAQKYYKDAFNMGYRKKLALYHRARMYRRIGQLTMEKRVLLFAEQYEFEYQTAKNDEIQADIEERLEKLSFIHLKEGYKVP